MREVNKNYMMVGLRMLLCMDDGFFLLWFVWFSLFFFLVGCGYYEKLLVEVVWY